MVLGSFGSQKEKSFLFACLFRDHLEIHNVTGFLSMVWKGGFFLWEWVMLTP